jgi:hypothetical protein
MKACVTRLTLSGSALGSGNLPYPMQANPTLIGAAGSQATHRFAQIIEWLLTNLAVASNQAAASQDWGANS